MKVYIVMENLGAVEAPDFVGLFLSEEKAKAEVLERLEVYGKSRNLTKEDGKTMWSDPFGVKTGTYYDFIGYKEIDIDKAI